MRAALLCLSFLGLSVLTGCADLAAQPKAAVTATATVTATTTADAPFDQKKADLETIKSAGFSDVRVLKRLDYFAKSASESTRRITKTFGAESVVVAAGKPKDSRESRSVGESPR